MRARCAWLLALGALAGLGCKREHSERSRCSLEQAHLVARAGAPLFDDVAIDTQGARSLAAYSSRDGLFVRELSAEGVPSSVAIRVGEPCTGGVDIELAGAEALLACLRRQHDEDAQGALLYTLSAALHTTSELALGRAGRDGAGIDVESDGERVHVLFHDGSRGAHTVHLVTLQQGRLTDRVISRPGRVASEPSLLVAQGVPHAVFTETELRALNAEQTEVVMVRGTEPARALARVRVSDPAPQLTRDAQGLVLTFRDQLPRDKRPELYATRLRSNLSFAAAPHKIGRANTEGPPTLHACTHGNLALLPREYGGEFYIAIHPLDVSLHNTSGGHQFYGNSRDFVRSAGSCSQRDLLLLAAERKTPADQGVELFAMRFVCRG